MHAPDPPICDYEGSDYQASFWQEGGREYEDRTEAIALRRLLPDGGELLLELGAGAGRNTPRYAGFQRVVLLDYSRSQLEQAQARLGASDRYVFVAADVYHLPFVEGLFDAATMIRVLHHMVDAPRALRQVHQALKPNAIFILEFANKRNLKSIVRYMLGRQSWNPFAPEPVEFARLNFDFHPRQVQNWLEQIGFAVERKLTVSHFRTPLLKRFLPLAVLVALDSLLQSSGKLWQLTPSVFYRMRGGSAGASSAKVHADAASFFRCPACGQTPLIEVAGAVTCGACGRRWGFADGIYDFRQPLAETA